MLLQETMNRQTRLETCIKDLAKSLLDDTNGEKRKNAQELNEIYSTDFRHDYSKFFPIILKIASDTVVDGQSLGNLDYLCDNLKVLKEFVEESCEDGVLEYTDLRIPLNKLCDHLNLEIGRYNHFSQNEQKLKDMETRHTTLTQALETATAELHAADEKLKTVQTELTAVLSIFAAIVLTFAGSLGFTSSALQGMTDAPFFKAVFFVSLCGMIVFNIIFLMMYLVGKIIGRNIYARCESEDCTCGVNGSPKCDGLSRVRKRLPYIFWLNTLLAIVLTVSFIMWWQYDFAPAKAQYEQTYHQPRQSSVTEQQDTSKDSGQR